MQLCTENITGIYNSALLTLENKVGGNITTVCPNYKLYSRKLSKQVKKSNMNPLPEKFGVKISLQSVAASN